MDYNIFIQFFDKFRARGFQDIDPKDPLLLTLNSKLQSTGQLLHIADLIQLKQLYCSKEFYDFFGLIPGKEDPSVFIKTIHPDDATRFGKFRSKAFKISAEMVDDKIERMILSSNFKTKTPKGNYVDLLSQFYFFYTEMPYKTVISIVVNTDIGHLLVNNKGYHYYLGFDETYFRYPDQDLVNSGPLFSEREFEILKCISTGMKSHEIAEKLFLSVHTVNTHRRNILIKTGKRTTHEIVVGLMESGII